MTLKLDKDSIELDADQMKAVEHLEGPALVVAGPGSGKTTVIKKRILHLIQKQDVAPWKILALAFNKEAVNEIAKRVLRELDSNQGRSKIRTLHGFGKDIVTLNYKQADFEIRPETKQDKIQSILDEEREQIERESTDIPVYIYKIEDLITKTCYIGQTTDLNRRKEEHDNRSSNDELWQVGLKEGSHKTLFEQIDKTSYSEADECEAYWIQHYRELPGGVFNQSDPVRRRYINQVMIEMFCKHFDIPCDALLKRKEDFKDLTDIFNKMQDEVKKEKRQVDRGLFKPDSIVNDGVRVFAQKYEEVKSKANAIDFEDMLIYSAYVLENSENLRQYYRSRYSYVLVDEFQDLSPADFRLIRQLSKNLFAVGDDDQAIYGFRGGDSEIMQTFYNRGDVSKYKVTRNYRSTATIVEHAKTLIEYNKNYRIPKNLSAKNPRQFPIKVLETTPETVEKTLVTEFTEPVCQIQLIQKHLPILKNILLPKLESKTAILARTNAEVDKIKKMIEKLIPRLKKDIEVSTIHKAKGQEYDRVILIANTLDVWETSKPYKSLPSNENDENEKQRVFDEYEERRVFYVAMTRAKQELIILGGNCRFISELQNVKSIETVESRKPFTKKDLEEAFKVELAAQEPKLKIELEESSKAALVALESRLKKELQKASKVARKQYEPELNRLRHLATETKNEVKEMELAFQQQLKSTKDTFLEGLIPALDEFESLIKSVPATNESNSESDDFVAFTEEVQLTQEQLLDSLRNHGLRPIEALGEIFNPAYHEETLPAIYSDEVNAGWISREVRRGYLLHDQIIRKAEVVVSKGQNIRTPEQLDRVVEIYLNRLIASEFGPKYDLDKPTIKRKMAKYLSELDDESLKKINSAATIDTTEYIKKHPLGNYCVGQATTHMCTDVVFRNFWKHMWEVVEESKKTSKPKIKHAQPSVDPPLYTSKTRENTSTVLSRKIVNRTLTWDEIATAYKTGTPVKGRITERIKGGLRVSVGSLRGFLSASQVELRPIQNLEQYVGQTLDMKVISLSKRRHNIILSRRAWLEAEFVQKRSEVLNTLEVGQHVPGVVKDITAFGAFVDLSGIDGLLHKSEMAWKHINHPSEVVSVGEDIEVKVIKFDRENEKISLSLKQMTNDPWESAEEKYPVRSTIQGTVTNIVNFGAFVQLEEGIEGLIHVSKMPLDANNTFPSDFMNKNDEVEVIVLEISKDSKRISLGMKSDRQNPFEAKKVVAPSDEPPPIVKIATDISNELTEQKISGPIKEIEAETPIPKAPPIVAEDVNSHSNESTDSIIPKPHEEVVNTPPISKELSEILNSQIQVLKPETLETEIVSEPLEIVDNNTEKTLHEYNDILNTHIEELKPEIPEIENPDNITKTLTLEIEADSGTPVDPTALTRSDSPTSTDSDAHQIKGEAFSENEVEHVKKNLGYYLRQGGRFAVEKIKGTIFRKPTS